ncbi:hypothetical protein [Cryobacterium tagatosivorans]|uniref:Transcriptional regulator n=1 Tax=Cryobacterium tagatosivorans TaxID=1259199 RepID=A0A4R8UBG6_9MICO|nr:hypothetical protein [Cryobacterium tagatosivorans]TFB47818.1 hypothetical protein E3O23_14525 [Cryobacterium tagatosivorans]
MIGVIGSPDSVALALAVAADIGLADQVIGRSYSHVDDVPSISQDLDRVCQVLLFTGRVPFSQAVGGEHVLHATVDFVPHTAIDLYRTLSLVLLRNGGHIPTVSIDTIDEDVVAEVFNDLGVTSAFRVLSLDAGRGRLRSSDEVVRFHLDALREGRATMSLTCLGAVKRTLDEAGVSVMRIEHTRSTLRQALSRAASALKMAEVEGSQLTAAVLRPLDNQRRHLPPPHVRSFSEQLRGVARPAADGTWVVHTTIAAVQSMTLAGGAGVPEGWAVGYGAGATLLDAEANARRALALAGDDHGPFTVFPDGSVFGLEATGVAGYRLRETDDLLLSHAREMGMRPLTLARLTVALRGLDPSAFTARELAAAYGGEARSARRMLATLQRAGVATVRGAEGPPRAGRPQAVYQIDVDLLVPRR